MPAVVLGDAAPHIESICPYFPYLIKHHEGMPSFVCYVMFTVVEGKPGKKGLTVGHTMAIDSFIKFPMNTILQKSRALIQVLPESQRPAFEKKLSDFEEAIRESGTQYMAECNLKEYDSGEETEEEEPPKPVKPHRGRPLKVIASKKFK